MATGLHKRWSLYVQYKTYSVSSETLKLDDSMTMEQNYKAIFLQRRRIQRCLQARQTVYNMYNDGDDGHFKAIKYTQEQLTFATELMSNICARLNEKNADHNPTLIRAPIEGAEGDSKKKRNQKKKKKRPITSLHDKTLEEESELEWQVLQQESDRRTESLRASFEQVASMISEMEETESLRAMLRSNVGHEEHLFFIYHVILGIALRAKMVDAPIASAHPKSIHLICSEASELCAWNATNPPSRENLKAAILHMACHEVITKKRLFEKILGATPLICGDIPQMSASAINRLGAYIFRECFDLVGDHTTHATASVVLSTLKCIAITVLVSCRWSESSISVINNNDRAHSRLINTLGAQEVARIENTVHHLYGQLDPAPSHPLRISWMVMQHFPEFLISVRVLRKILIGNGGENIRRPVPFIVRLDKTS